LLWKNKIFWKETPQANVTKENVETEYWKAKKSGRMRSGTRRHLQGMEPQAFRTPNPEMSLRERWVGMFKPPFKGTVIQT
jgi:hypothetical protein